MILKDRLAWLQQTQKGLMDYLTNPDDLKGSKLSFKKQLKLIKEVARLDKKIKELKALPNWALKFDTAEGEVLLIDSRGNKNRQGVELGLIRELPKTRRTWTSLQLN